jgi:hypothetical protein
VIDKEPAWVDAGVGEENGQVTVAVWSATIMSRRTRGRESENEDMHPVGVLTLC